MTARWRTAGAVGVLLAAVALPLPGLMRYQGPPMEEGFMLVFGERFLAGDVPNRDFLHLYGPGSVWVLAGVFRLFGASLAAERMVGLAQQAGIVGALFSLALPWGRRAATVVGLLALVLILPPIGLTALAWNGAVALGLAALAVGLAARRHADQTDGDGARVGRLLLLAGILGGLALLYRPDLVVAVALAGAALAWGLDRARIGRLLAGLALGTAPYVVHLAMAGPGPAIEGMFFDPVFRLRGGRSLPVPPSWNHLDGFLQRAGVLRVVRWPLPAPSTSQQIFLWFFLLIAAAVAVAAAGVWAMRRHPTEHRSRVLLVVGLFAVGLLPQAVQRPDTTHFAWVSCVGLAFVPIAILEVARRPLAKLPPGWRGLVAGGAVAVLLGAALPFFTYRPYADLTQQTFGRNAFGFPIRRDGRVFYYGSPDAAAAAQRLVADLDGRLRPGQRLLVGPVDLRKTPYSDAFFYFLFPELTPATRYIEMDPGMANAPGSGLAGEVAAADWLILSDTWSDWDEPNDSRVFGPDAPNRVVARDFCRVGAYDDFFYLYRRCSAPS